MRDLAIVLLVASLTACATRIDVGPVEVAWQVGDAVVCTSANGQQASATFNGETVTLTGDCVWTGHVSPQGSGLIGNAVASFFKALFGV